MQPDVVDRLIAAGAIPGARRARVCPVKLDTTALPGGSIVMLLFVNDEHEPSYVVRTPRTPDQPQRILRNFSTLQYLSQLRSLSPSIPRPIFCGQIDGEVTSVETCVPGLPLAVPLRHARYEGRRQDAAWLFSVAAQWLWTLHVSTALQPAGTDGRQNLAERRSAHAVCLMQDLHVISESQARSLFGALRLTSQPIMPRARIHGDYNPNNMLLNGSRTVSVIDWEFSVSGWALWDLFTLARSAWFHPPGISDPDAALAQEIWDPRTPMGRAFLAALKRYEGRWGIRREQCRLLFGLYIAEYILEQKGPALEKGLSSAWRSLMQAAVEY